MGNMFWDNVVETRVFDNNGKSLTPDQADNASVFLAHTTGNFFGDKWFAVSGVSGYQLGNEKTPGLALLWGMKNVISDQGKSINIRFERGELGSDDRRYQQRVIIDGEHRATFKPNSFGVEYDLVDLEKRHVTVYLNSRGYGHYAQANNKADMENVVRRWFEFIPTDEQLEKRQQQEATKEKRQQQEAAEEKRLELICLAAPEMFDALEGLMEMSCFAQAHGQMWDKIRAAITKARGVKHDE